jgi:tRNA nucleotidyltransferase (CCA-adding enzyme)
VRILRVARFYARFRPLGFRVAPETVELMRGMVANGEVDALQAERVWQETKRGLMETDPAAFFELLRECGALARLFPEVDALFGVPQAEKHHPEIDTGVHLMMVLAQTAKMKAVLEVRFAALCHDLGKGVTPPQLLPKHYGHESSGLPLVEAVCARLRVPNDCRELALLVTQFHLYVHLAQDLNPGTMMDLFEKTGAFKRPERFEHFLQACEADARGRKGLESREYPQPDYLREALRVAAAIQAGPIVASGLTGEAIGVELRKQRTHALKAWREARRAQ